MRMAAGSFVTALLTLSAFCYGQDSLRVMSLRDGETLPLRTVTWISPRCDSLFLSFEGIDLLEGPSQISLTFELGKVLATNSNCSKQVNGGTVYATAKDVTQEMDAVVTLRIRMKTKDGPKQVTQRYRVLLFPTENSRKK